ncbi:TetR/AcrR family transcriptional regulator [bacterium]|nr:TetR/AcrR family transcriptional regulator [bacterium]
MANESATSWKDRRKEQLHDDLVAAAAGLFREKGFNAVSVEDIVAATGIAKGTFYLYFKTKTQIVESVLGACLDDLEKRISTALEAASSDASDPLQAVVGIIMQFLQENPGFVTPIMDAAPVPDIGEAVLLRCRTVTISVFERLLRMGMLQGRYREIDPQAASLALQGMLSGLVRFSADVDIKFTDVGEIAVELFERGVKR